jgi:hypothetical protein
MSDLTFFNLDIYEIIIVVVILSVIIYFLKIIIGNIRK